MAEENPYLAEVRASWKILESHGFPPEACGWPFRDITGCLPEAIDCAIDCLVRQRNALQREVRELRKPKSGGTDSSSARPTEE